MPFVDYNKSGVKTQYKATAWTCVIYEQEFGRDLIKDIYGKIDVTHVDSAGVLDFTQTNWTCVIRAFWAMVKTADPSTPSFDQWAIEQDTVDLPTMSASVVDECFRRLTPSLETEEVEEGGDKE